MVILHNEMSVKLIVGWLKVCDDGADPEKLVTRDELMDRKWALGTTGVGKHWEVQSDMEPSGKDMVMSVPARVTS